MKRRQFIKSTGGALATLSLVGVSSPRSTTADIETSIFIDKNTEQWLVQLSETDLLEASYDLLETAVQPIDDVNIFRTTPDVHTVDISTMGVRTDGVQENLSDIYTSFQSYLMNNVDERYISDHSNILILGSNTVNLGMGTTPNPCFLSFGNRVSIVPISSMMHDIRPADTYRSTNFEFDSFATTLIHEFGHNLGFEHEHGKYVEKDEEHIYVTPMLSKYICDSEYTGQLNEFLQEVPRIEDCGEYQLMIRKHFNDELSRQQISEDCFNCNAKPVWNFLS